MNLQVCLLPLPTIAIDARSTRDPPPFPCPKQDISCAGSVQVTATTELAELLEDLGNHLRQKQVIQSMQVSQGGAGGLLEEGCLSQQAS